jgi:hypothetical protein
MIALHSPLLLIMLAIHTVGGVLTHSTNFVVGILNAGSAYLQNLMSHVVTGVSGMVLDIRTVAKGRSNASHTH